MRRYNEAVKADVRRRMGPPHRQNVSEISQVLGIHVITLYKSRKARRLQGELVPASQKDPEAWGPADKFTVALESAGLNATELGGYCREREEVQIAADLLSRACLRERISKGRPNPLILHAVNGNAMRAATLESRLEELGVLRSFSRLRVSIENPYSESLFRTVKYRPNYPRRPFTSDEETCAWVAAFVSWYNDQHRHSAIRFVTPSQRHS